MPMKIFFLKKLNIKREKNKAYSTLPYKWTYLPQSYLLLEPHFLVDHHTNKTKRTRLVRLTKCRLLLYSHHNLIKGPSLFLKVPP